MITVTGINIAPVKSLGLQNPTCVTVGPRGIKEDRRFHLVDSSQKLVTQREIFTLVQIEARYDLPSSYLELNFPDGKHVADKIILGEKIDTIFWGRSVIGNLVVGPFNRALSSFCGADIRLISSIHPGQCQDEYPISILSEPSLLMPMVLPGTPNPLDSRRFRPTFLLSGSLPHEEDKWLSRSILIGDSLQLMVKSRDPRCAITTHHPDTGSPDLDTLRLILEYRPADRPYFGVYAEVECSGIVSLGDVVRIIS